MKNEIALVFSDQQITPIIHQGRHPIAASSRKSCASCLSELASVQKSSLARAGVKGINTLKNPKGRASRFRCARQRHVTLLTRASK